jgi:hypothetical protein
MENVQNPNAAILRANLVDQNISIDRLNPPPNRPATHSHTRFGIGFKNTRGLPDPVGHPDCGCRTVFCYKGADLADIR